MNLTHTKVQRGRNTNSLNKKGLKKINRMMAVETANIPTILAINKKSKSSLYMFIS